jgi:CHAT domain-containing protein
MREVLGLRLTAERVALTACNPGVGQHRTGEGVMGLGRAFQYAGARSMLISLWSVEDESPNRLSERVCMYLQQGQATLEVLHQARADLRQAGHGHPFFWTPFIPVEE